LHAVLLPSRDAGARMLEAISAALDGTGPAILPLDPALPRARIEKLITAFAPGSGVADDVAVVLPTSGSTGVPKGAELSAPALLASARASLDRLGAASGERWLCCLPLHHISGLAVLARSLVAGTEPVIRDRVDALSLGSEAEDLGCRYVSLVPTQLRRLLAAGAPLAGFRAILLGGAAIPAGMLDEAAAAGARIVTSYGMTETCGGCVYDGVPFDGVQVAAGADGSIRVAGPVLFSGYRLAPELTRTVLRDGWFTTSDLGEVTAAGRLVVRGRADDVINTGGEKVVAGEVEQVLRGCPGVRDAVILGIADPEWGERVSAVIIPADAAAPPALDDLRAYVRDRLPRHAAPRTLVFVTELPMLSSGKPDRQKIRDIVSNRAHLAASVATRPPSPPEDGN